MAVVGPIRCCMWPRPAPVVTALSCATMKPTHPRPSSQASRVLRNKSKPWHARGASADAVDLHLDRERALEPAAAISTGARLKRQPWSSLPTSTEVRRDGARQSQRPARTLGRCPECATDEFAARPRCATRRGARHANERAVRHRDQGGVYVLEWTPNLVRCSPRVGRGTHLGSSRRLAM